MFGSGIIVVDPAETSQTCSACQAVDAESRISRSRFVCTNCGSIFDADVIAAKNILKPSISPTGGLPGMACEWSRTTGWKQEEDARESGSSALFRAESSHMPIDTRPRVQRAPSLPCALFLFSESERFSKTRAQPATGMRRHVLMVLGNYKSKNTFVVPA